MRRLSRVALITTLLCGTLAAPARGDAVVILQFRNFVQASPFLDGTNWFLTQPLRYQIPGGQAIVEVPVGFQTDFASIPRPFWSILPKWGKYGPAAVAHDFLYWDQRCTREQADAVLLLAMAESQVNPVHRALIYRAVRWGGAIGWKANRKDRAAGRERIIPSEFAPTDPTTTWQQLQDAIFAAGHRPEARPSHDPVPTYCTEAELLWREFLSRKR